MEILQVAELLIIGFLCLDIGTTGLLDEPGNI